MGRATGGSRAEWSRLNPAATVEDQLRARQVFDGLAARLADRGALAVVLGGSWSRGEAHRASDIDVWVLGHRYGQTTLFREGFPIHIERTTSRIERARFRDPRRAGGCVPGWRAALPVYDPHGLAARLQEEARRFRWSAIGRACDRWVSDQVSGWAEEALKLVRALGEGHRETAAAQRNLLANGLVFVMAVHRRILWGSENGAWERAGRRVGGRWRVTQRAALGLDAVDFVSSARAALELYLRTAEAVRPVLRPEAVQAVEHVRGVLAGPTPSLGRVGRARPPC